MRYDQRVNIDNIPLGKGITGAAAESREVVRVHDTAKDPRYIASHPDIRSEVAVPLIVQDRVVGVMDLESEPHRLLHRRPRAHAGAAGAADGELGGERAALRRNWPQRERRMEEDLKAARELQRMLLPDAAPEIEGLEAAVRLRPAREIWGDIYDIFEQRDGHDRDRVRRRQRQGRRGGALRRPGERPVAHAGAAAPQSRRADAGAQRSAGGAQSGSALRDAVVLLWDPTTRQIVMANAGALPPMICRGGEILKIRVEGVPLGLLDAREYEEITFQARARRHHRALLRRHHRSHERRRAPNSGADVWRKWCGPIATSRRTI